MDRGNYYMPYSLRVSEELLAKLKYIAKEHKRSANKEAEWALELYIQAYEKEFGEIEVEIK